MWLHRSAIRDADRVTVGHGDSLTVHSSIADHSSDSDAECDGDTDCDSGADPGSLPHRQAPA